MRLGYSIRAITTTLATTLTLHLQIRTNNYEQIIDTPRCDTKLKLQTHIYLSAIRHY